MTVADQRGSIMIPVLIGFFIVAVLATSLMDTMNLNLKEAGSQRELAGVTDDMRRVLDVLRDPAICTANLRGRPSNVDSQLSLIKSNRSGTEQVTIQVDDAVPGSDLHLRTLRLHDFRAYTTGPGAPDIHGTMELDFLFEPPQGGLSRRRSLLVSTELDPGTTQIKTCVALGSSADHWKLTPASDIWYGGRVAIGDVRVPSPDYQLFIAGMVQSDDYYHLSDRRAKTHVRPLATHEDLSALRGVRYRWRRDRRPAMGVLAQDVERVYPNAVTSAADTTKAVDYDQLIAPLIERVKALAAQNRDLTRRLKNLRRQNDASSL